MVIVQSALVARQIGSKNHFDLIKFLPKKEHRHARQRRNRINTDSIRVRSASVWKFLIVRMTLMIQIHDGLLLSRNSVVFSEIANLIGLARRGRSHFPSLQKQPETGACYQHPDHSEGCGHVGHAKAPAPLESCAWLTRGAFAPDCARAVRSCCRVV
jgi:hypothetical protein